MRTSPIAALALAPLFLLVAVNASAQPQPKPPLPAAPSPPGKPPAPPAEALPELPKVEVNDPLLAPIPPAPHLLNSFHDALMTISAHSTDLAIAQQEVERAEGSSRQALAAALTTVNGSASISQSLLGGGTTIVNGTAVSVSNGPTAQVSISASQPILAPRAWYGIKTAKLNVKAVQQSTDNQRRIILAQVASSIVAVYTAERVAEISRVSLRNSLQRLNLAERKARLGDGTRLDVLRAQQDAAVARGQLISGDESLRKTREALGLSLGSNEPWGVPATISLDEMQQALGSSCQTGTVEDRPDVAAARTSLEIAQRGVVDSKLAFLPTAGVQSTASASKGPSSAFSDGSQTSWTISAVLNLPIWEGGARYGTMRIARANAEEARLRLDAARRGASFEAIQAQRSVTVAEEARVVSEQNRDLAREAARLAERAFAAGAGTSFDLIDAGKNERNAELDLAVKEFDLIRSRIASLLATANCNY
jgi:multidrug efflux system outer membrane protein